MVLDTQPYLTLALPGNPIQNKASIHSGDRRDTRIYQQNYRTNDSLISAAHRIGRIQQDA